LVVGGKAACHQLLLYLPLLVGAKIFRPNEEGAKGELHLLKRLRLAVAA